MQMGESRYPRIRNLREDADLTQEEMAKMLNVNRRTYGAYETGANMWPVDIVAEIAKEFNISVDYFLDLTDDPRPYKRKK